MVCLESACRRQVRRRLLVSSLSLSSFLVHHAADRRRHGISTTTQLQKHTAQSTKQKRIKLRAHKAQSTKENAHTNAEVAWVIGELADVDCHACFFLFSFCFLVSICSRSTFVRILPSRIVARWSE